MRFTIFKDITVDQTTQNVSQIAGKTFEGLPLHKRLKSDNGDLPKWADL